MNPGTGGREQDADRDDDRHSRDADEREHLADERDMALDAREALTAGREVAQADRRVHEQQILAGAAERDDEADAPDVVADKRDQAVSLNAFLAGRDDFGPALEARRSAAVDRLSSKTDRTSSAQDLADLTEGEPEQ